LLHNLFYDDLRGDPWFLKLIDGEKKNYNEAMRMFRGMVNKFISCLFSALRNGQGPA